MGILAILGILLLISVGVNVWLLSRKTEADDGSAAEVSTAGADIANPAVPVGEGKELGDYRPTDVGEFYDGFTEKFMEVYGEIIQAFRTKDVNKLLDYQLEAMEIKDGQKLLDAGCGIGGPAVYFAEKRNVTVDGATISDYQVKRAAQHIEEHGVGDRVKVIKCDYHFLKDKLEAGSYDLVYFLESFGHSHDHERAIDSAWEMLKQGGHLYIKDLFIREPLLEEHRPKIMREVGRINEGYKYNIADMYRVLKKLRTRGFVIQFVKTIDLKVEDFENLTISNVFQELFDVAKIQDWSDYVFPVEFYEIKCYKPVYDLQNGLDKYFLQNLYYMQVHDKSEAEL